jgi:hypothetical protein
MPHPFQHGYLPVTINQRGDWDFTIIEKKVLVPTDDDPGQFTVPDDGVVVSFNGLSDVVPNHKAILREDTGQVFYIGSDRYQPVPHRTVLEPIITRLSQSTYKIQIRSINHGAEVFADFVSTESFMMAGERYRSGIRIVNSLDGSLRLMIEGFIYRERDDSYLVLSETLTSFTRVHVLGRFTDADFARIAREAMDAVVSKVNALILVSGIRIADVAFKQLIERIDMPKKYKQLALEIWETPDIAQIENSAVGTLGAVLNLLAYLGTHELPRTLNDEAVYRWQRNVDAVVKRTVTAVSGPFVAVERRAPTTTSTNANLTAGVVPAEAHSR